MKKQLYIIACLCFTLLNTGCEEFLDITPDGQVSRQSLLSSNEGVEDALYGVYSRMRIPELYGSRMTFSLLDVLAHQFSCRGNSTVEALQSFDYQNTSVQDMLESVWTRMYNNISNVNSVLNSSIVANANGFPRNIYKGEALALRAFMHFDLVRLFAPQVTLAPSAKGIPYATQFSLKTPEFESVADNYKHIVADLLEAERLLKDDDVYAGKTSFMTDRQIHLNLHAVRALLARVYLTLGDYSNARRYADLVIAQSGRSLCKPTDFRAQQHGMLLADETLFGLYHRTWYDDVVSTMLYGFTDRSSYTPTANILSHYVGDDCRGGTTGSGYFGYNGISSNLRLTKLGDNGSVTPADGFIPGINLIKLCEMHYIAAECLLQSSSPADQALAADHIHAVYDSRRAPYTAGSAVTLNDITEERYREMIGEGQMFFHYKRLNIGFDKVLLTDADPQETVDVASDNGIFTPPVPIIENDYRN